MGVCVLLAAIYLALGWLCLRVFLDKARADATLSLAT
jgi:hypothetical protein